MGFGNVNSDILGGITAPRRKKLARPTYDPIDMTGIESSRKRMQDADRLADDPLSAPGVQQQLGVISEGLNRQFAAEKGNVMSRAAQSGQAGFGGSFSQSAAALSGDLASTRAQEQSDMMMDVYQKARKEGLDANAAMTQAQNEVSRIKNERTKIDADLAAQEAELWQREDTDYRTALLAQARLAEEARQYNQTDAREDERFDYLRETDSRDFDYEKNKDKRDFDYRRDENRRGTKERSDVLEASERARIQARFDESYRARDAKYGTGNKPSGFNRSLDWEDDYESPWQRGRRAMPFSMGRFLKDREDR